MASLALTLLLACDPGTPLVNPALWMQSAAEYRASALQTYALARRALDDALQEPSSLPPAIILDLDETALDNSRFAARAIAKQTTFTFGSDWSAWVRESASDAVPGAQEFLAYARGRGVTPFYVTNRTEDMRAATRANLERLGFPVDAGTLVMREENAPYDKSARREAIGQRYRVILLLGDALSDFTSAKTPVDDAAWGTRWFVVPNSMYGSWEKAVDCGSE
jgi:5'-nucleotidase (lipoprotein e(P4) family)